MVIAVSSILAVAMAACGADDGTGATSQPTATSPPTTVPPVTETMFGSLRSFEDTGSALVVAVDRAEMLTGEAAVAAAREDGAIGEDEDLPNDYYIRNPDHATDDFEVSPNAVVTLQACYPNGECVTTEMVDLETWSVLLGAEEDPGLDWDWYGSGALPYTFTVEAGVITKVEEQYLP